MSSAADLFTQSLVDMGRAMRASREAEQQQARDQAAQQAQQDAWNLLQQEFDELSFANACNLAEKMALRAQLARYAPKHPLLVNKLTQEKVRELGARAFAQRRNFDDAREVGTNFFPPDMPPIEGK